MTLDAPPLPDPALTGPDGPLLGCGPIRPETDGGGSALRHRVFECVRAAGQISRSDVAKQLRVSPGSVTALVGELLDLGLVHEQPDLNRPSSRGRPPVALSVRPDAGFVVGIKLSRTHHTALLVDAAGRPLAQASVPCAMRRRSLDQILLETAQVLDDLLDQAGLHRADIACIGLGMPGIIDHASGRMIWSPLLTDENRPLRTLAETAFGVPVAVDNDANLVTLAELWFGKGREMADFAVVTIEDGVGMGLVINHRLYRGAGGLGMELGHTKVQLDGALCQCGQRGCLEAYVADYALVREASTALDPTGQATQKPEAMLEQLYEQAKAGNEAARTIFSRAGRFLALGLANVVNLFDPPLIILAGERMQYDYLYAEEVLAEMQAQTLNRRDRAQRVETHEWGDLMWAHGAAALALSDTADAMAAGKT
ncbi:ROK family transcriptional regulator [Sulfitobacter sabulilitoris]|uniref:ROK family transcriptional regulator n=1 Tax=Sulfitobacter sabulilitoris TaxID=2562655 RepID=A0A5S3PI77_9RHOB|nr:ROK family transcriptional regulator [Sulfitobacter sabulilitoris]TMM54054.1 ROK family transcriptional regulator [Sulfitobacter sabulilitoris]